MSQNQSIIHCKPSLCNPPVPTFSQGKLICFNHRKNLLSLQGWCSHCREPVFKTVGSLHAPCSSLERNTVNNLMYQWGYSSVVEHSTADGEVPGSNLVAPFLLLFLPYLVFTNVKNIKPHKRIYY